MTQPSPNEAELRDFLRQRITGISTAAEDDIVGWFERYSEARASAARIEELKMAIFSSGRILVGDTKVIDTSNLESGNPNLIDAAILEARLGNLERQLLGQEGES